MNYTWVEKLKDAGYPLKQVYGGLVDQVFGDEDHFEVPTLSELIEACGDRFYALTTSSFSTFFKWNAYGKAKEEVVDNSKYDRDRFVGGGDTPEEAVAL